MWEYIITWTLVTIVPVQCPDANKTDEFGRGAGITGATCCVYHTDTEYENKEKTFSDRDLAFAFYNRAKKESEKDDMYNFQGGLQSVKIDSVFDDSHNSDESVIK